MCLRVLSRSTLFCNIFVILSIYALALHPKSVMIFLESIRKASLHDKMIVSLRSCIELLAPKFAFIRTFEFIPGSLCYSFRLNSLFVFIAMFKYVVYYLRISVTLLSCVRCIARNDVITG